MSSVLKRIVFALLFWLLMLSAAQAATYYVHQGCTNNTTAYNPSGAGSCTGGSARVYSTINNALSGGLLVAGSILDIRAGTYAEAILSSNGNVPLGGTDWGSG